VIVKTEAKPRKSSGRIPRHAAARASWWSRRDIAALALIALLVPLNRWWSAELLLVPLLLIAPGLILLRALRIPAAAVSPFPAYVPCASLIVLFSSGLLVDLLGPFIGVAEPLRPWPLLTALEVTCLILLAVSRSAPASVEIPWHSFSQPIRLTWPFILPLIAAAGALRLNNGHSNSVALIAICLVIATLIAAVIVSSRTDDALLDTILYSCGLAIVWSDSLRGDPIYGFDIATELQRLQSTIAAGIWHAGHPNDAYGAMLSVTVLPAELHALSGIPGLLIFKVIFPMIYAFFPVAIFGLGRRVISRCWAFVAAVFTMGQYAFPEMAGFARQELALVLFAALLAAMLETQMQRRSQWGLVALLAVTMALSHYSTTYVAVTVIGLALPLQLGLSFLRSVPRVNSALVVGFVAASASAFIWYVPVTASNAHVLQVAQTVESQGLNFLPNRAPGGSLLSAYLQGNTKTPIAARKYEQRVHEYYSSNKRYIKPLADASNHTYALHDSTVPEPPVKWRYGYAALNVGLLILEQLANLLAGIGALALMFRRKVSVLARQVGLLALAATLLLSVLRFSGTLAVAYGQERAQLQGLVLLAVTMCWCLERLSGMRKALQTRILSAGAACLAVILVNTTYLAGAVLGGITSVNLANSGRAFEYLYVTAPELASAQWLERSAGPGQFIYSDEYGQVPLATVTNIQSGLYLDITPLTLNRKAWVYATRTNVVDGRAFALYHQHLATYVFPGSFLADNYDLVYTNGSSEVFHR
jgi:uncharacterized membrane protein